MDTYEESALKIITLNIEGDNHLDKAIAFFQKEQPDVICLQEVFEKDADRLEKELKMKGLYIPLVYVGTSNNARLTPGNKWGLLLLTKLEVHSLHSEYYSGSPSDLPAYKEGDPNVVNRAILIAKVLKGSALYQIITTHFTWSPNGQTISLQKDMLLRLFSLLEKKGELILCGDFNAPRGEEIWEKLAQRYIDNVPHETISTIDPNLHKVKNILYVVDGMFSTKAYSMRDVYVIEGVSDHKAIVATVEKRD